MRQKFQTAERSLISVRLNINSFFTLCLFCKFREFIIIPKIVPNDKCCSFCWVFFLLLIATFYCSTYVTVNKKEKKKEKINPSVSLGIVHLKKWWRMNIPKICRKHIKTTNRVNNWNIFFLSNRKFYADISFYPTSRLSKSLQASCLSVNIDL